MPCQGKRSLSQEMSGCAFPTKRTVVRGNRMKEEKSFAGFVRKKCVTKPSKPFFVVEPHRRQGP